MKKKNIILKYIEEYGQAPKKELDNLLKDKLPSSLNEKNKINRIRYLIEILKKENKIYNDVNSGMSCWKIKK